MTLLDGLRLLQAGAWDQAHRIAQADTTPCSCLIFSPKPV